MARQIVADVMHRDVPVVPEAASYKQVAIALATHHTRALPVVDADGKVAGIVSESDLIERPADEAAPHRPGSRWRHTGRHRKAGARMAVTLMTCPVVHVGPDTDLAAAARIAIDADVHQLPVLDGDTLVGMVDRSDLLAGYLRSDETIRDEIISRVLVDDFCIDPGCVNVSVCDGIAVVSGCVEHRPLGVFLLGAVRAVPGVVDVESRLGWRHEYPITDPRRRRRLLP